MARTLSPGVRHALEQAIDAVCYERGVHLASLDEICRRAAVGKPALYRHFGDRDAVVLDYLRRRVVERRASMTRAMDDAGTSPDARVVALTNWVALWISSAEFRGCGFHRAMLQRPDELEELVNITAQMKSWLLGQLEAELPDRPDLARHLFLLIEGAMAASMYERNGLAANDLRELVRSQLDLR